MLDAEKDAAINRLVDAIDAAIDPFYTEIALTNIAAVLLSRVTHLTVHDPEVGKGLLQHAWTQLDEIEQSNPGGLIP
jgi:hypothetical protein